MKINSVMPFNFNKHNQNDHFVSKPVALQNNANLAMDANYGRYIAFKSLSEDNKAHLFQDLKLFLNDTIDPFLDEHMEIYTKNEEIHVNASKMYDLYMRNKGTLNDNTRWEFKPEEIGFINENLGKVFEYRNNVEEYSYLLNKSEKHFVSDETNEYAKSIKDEIFTDNEYILSMMPAVSRFNKMKMDIKNGLANDMKMLDENFKAKAENIREASTISLFNLSFVNDVLLYKNKLEETFVDMNDKHIIHKLLNSFKRKNDVLRSMENQKKHLPKIEENTIKAEKLLKENAFTKEDVEKAFSSVENTQNRTINKNVKKFKEFLDQNPQYKWDNNKTAQVQAVLDKQKQLIENLWHKIEADKKEFFSEENIRNRNWPRLPEQSDVTQDLSDDLPF